MESREDKLRTRRSRTAEKRREAETSASPRISGPDFLCIGMQKAGTTWLYDLLQFEPGFWMPPVKEFHFFDRPDDFNKRIQKLHRGMTKPFGRLARKRKKKQKRALDARDRMFIEHAITFTEGESTIEWYEELFAAKGNLLSGDVTPGYSALDGSTIESIARKLPGLRLILLLRDPVSRLWSQFNMNRRGKIIDDVREPSASFLSAFYRVTPLDEVADFVNREAVRSRSFPSEIYSNWRQHFDAARIKYLFFDDVVGAPGGVRRELLQFFDLPDTAPTSDRMALSFNRKSNAPKREMNDEVREFLVETFRDEILRCAETFGGAAEEWPERYGID